jgi:peptidoglycan/xylan/chitin deacetylase (PgdA/CDA1 family)
VGNPAPLSKRYNDMGQVLLTFDTEDFINENSIWFLRSLLLCLRRYDFKALFFITGHMAERLEGHAGITSLLEEHEIGFHSSSHSVHPTIFEYTDVASYEKAYEIALVRETSHINPLNGQMEGKGGIFAVRSIWGDKEIIAYRAPGFCWSPPHTEALRDLGVKFDFSSILAPTPVFYKGLTFYPYPAIREWRGRLSDYRMFISSALKRKVTVICIHPDFFVNQNNWDSIYHQGNPKYIACPRTRDTFEFKSMFHCFDLFLKRAKHMEQLGLIEVAPDLRKSQEYFRTSRDKIEKIFQHSVRWPRRYFGYEPKFLRNHFLEFFDMSTFANSHKSSLI